MGQWLNARGLTGRQFIDLPPVWLVGCIVLVWLQAAIWPAATISHPVLRVLGAVLFWGGLALMLWAILAFRPAKTSVVPHQTPQNIITTGIYARSRNPIYLADLIVLAGVIVGRGAWPCLILIPILAAILTRRFIAPEEARLKQYFETEFEEYVNKTPRWL